jgi:hypothetical protein
MVNIFESISFSIAFGVASVIDEEIKIMMSLSAVSSCLFFFFQIRKAHIKLLTFSTTKQIDTVDKLLVKILGPSDPFFTWYSCPGWWTMATLFGNSMQHVMIMRKKLASWHMVALIATQRRVGTGWMNGKFIPRKSIQYWDLWTGSVGKLWGLQRGIAYFMLIMKRQGCWF